MSETVKRSPRRQPTAVYPETAVLGPEQLAAALGIDVDNIDDHRFPTAYLGPRTRRYVWRQILAVLEQRAADALKRSAA